MKILLVTNMYPSKHKSYGGLFLKNQYQELLRWKNVSDEIDYFYMKRVLSGKFVSILKYLYASVRFLPYLFKTFDLVHLHFVFPLFIPVMIYKSIHPKTKIVFTWHGSDINNFFNGKVSKWIYHKMCNGKIDITSAVGDDLKTQVEAKLQQPIDIIMSAGVNHHIFFNEPTESKTYDFIFVGDFIWRKGVPQLIEAIRRIKKGTFHFCFCGHGELEKEIKALDNKHVKIDLFRNVHQKKLRSYFNASKFMIIPSNYEPFGLVATEAIFCGTPAIVSPVGGLPSQVIDQENGFIIPEVTPTDIYNTMMKAYNIDGKTYSSMALNATQSNKQYRIDVIAKKTLELYHNILEVNG